MLNKLNGNLATSPHCQTQPNQLISWIISRDGVKVGGESGVMTTCIGKVDKLGRRSL